jgi:hypothetical protein
MPGETIDIRMSPRRLSVRICAVLAAYALVLQALAANLTYAAHPTVDAITCLSARDAQGPAAQDAANGQDQNHRHDACALHCLAVAGVDGVAAPTTILFENLSLAEIRLLTLEPLGAPARAAFKTPQSPRAPPHA